MDGLCQVPKIMYTIFYAFNITLLIVIIVITTTERLFECIFLLSKMLQNFGSCVLLEGFTNFLVDPYYDPLSLVMIVGSFVDQTVSALAIEVSTFQEIFLLAHTSPSHNQISLTESIIFGVAF